MGEVQGQGYLGQALGVGCDVTDESAIEGALVALGDAPPIGALINNAGITSWALGASPPTPWRRA